jgi:hypothetical protein
VSHRTALELALSLAVAVVTVALGFGLVALGPLAVLAGGLGAIALGAWAGGRDSRDPADRWPFSPR